MDTHLLNLDKAIERQERAKRPPPMIDLKPVPVEPQPAASLEKTVLRIAPRLARKPPMSKAGRSTNQFRCFGHQASAIPGEVFVRPRPRSLERCLPCQHRACNAMASRISPYMRALIQSPSYVAPIHVAQFFLVHCCLLVSKQQHLCAITKGPGSFSLSYVL